MKNSNLLHIFRWMFCLPLFAFGLSHYANVEAMQSIVPSYMPFGGYFWTIASGTSLILAGLGIGLQILDKVAALCLAPTIFAFGFMVHFPLAMNGDAMATASFLKDFMIGAAILLYGFGLSKKTLKLA
jgi:uncharacterized membrane protein